MSQKSKGGLQGSTPNPISNSNSKKNRSRKKPSCKETISKFFSSQNSTELLSEQKEDPQSKSANQKRNKPLNLNDSAFDADDFMSPIPEKKPNLKWKLAKEKSTKSPKTNKDRKKNQQTLKIIKDNFGDSGENPEHMQMAIALSKSTFEAEYGSSISDTDHQEMPDISQILQNAKPCNLERFGFTAGKSVMGAEKRRPPLLSTDVTKRTRSRFKYITPVLDIRSVEERESLITSKISLILNNQVDNIVHKTTKMPVNSNKLQELEANHHAIFNLEYIYERNIFYVERLNLSPSKSKCGCLLKDLRSIIGRERSPHKSPNKDNIPDQKTVGEVITQSECISSQGHTFKKTLSSTTKDSAISSSKMSEVGSSYSFGRSISPDLFDSDDERGDQLSTQDNLQLFQHSASLKSNNYDLETHEIEAVIDLTSDDDMDEKIFKHALKDSLTASNSQGQDVNMYSLEEFEEDIDELCGNSSKKSSQENALTSADSNTSFGKTKTTTTEKRVSILNKQSPRTLSESDSDSNKIQECDVESLNDNIFTNISSTEKSMKVDWGDQLSDDNEYSSKCNTEEEEEISSKDDASKGNQNNKLVILDHSIDWQRNDSKSSMSTVDITPEKKIVDDDSLPDHIFENIGKSDTSNDPKPNMGFNTLNINNDQVSEDAKVLSEKITSEVNQNQKSPLLDNSMNWQPIDTEINIVTDLDITTQPHESKRTLSACFDRSKFCDSSDMDVTNYVHNILNKESVNMSDCEKITETCELSDDQGMSLSQNSQSSSVNDEELNYSCHFSTPMKNTKSRDKRGLNSPYKNLHLDKENGPSQNVSSEPRVDEGSSSKKFNTPDNVIIKTNNVTPMPEYDQMMTPAINKELQKFGLKPLKRTRGVKLLKHIYETTHPLVGQAENAEINESDSEEDKRVIKKVKHYQNIVAKETSVVSQTDVCPTIELVGDQILQNETPEDLIFERKQSAKIPSCQVPLQIVWHNFISSNPTVRENILLYEPLQLESLHLMLKEQGFKFHIQDLLTFLDRKCITIRTAQKQGKRHR